MPTETCTVKKDTNVLIRNVTEDKSQAEYNQHLLTHKQPKDKVSCPVCDKSFDLKKYLDEHLKAFR